MTVEAIAERAGVSKATVYRWWPNRAAVVMDGFLSIVSSQVPFPHTGRAREDIRIHMRRLAEAFSGKIGSTVAALIAEGQSDPELAEALRSRWLSVVWPGTTRMAQVSSKPFTAKAISRNSLPARQAKSVTPTLTCAD